MRRSTRVMFVFLWATMMYLSPKHADLDHLSLGTLAGGFNEEGQIREKGCASPRAADGNEGKGRPDQHGLAEYARTHLSFEPHV
jgi:hypothetical protein